MIDIFEYNNNVRGMYFFMIITLLIIITFLFLLISTLNPFRSVVRQCRLNCYLSFKNDSSTKSFTTKFSVHLLHKLLWCVYYFSIYFIFLFHLLSPLSLYFSLILNHLTFYTILLTFTLLYFSFFSLPFSWFFFALLCLLSI